VSEYVPALAADGTVIVNLDVPLPEVGTMIEDGLYEIQS
jgi:hypothetical protein